MRAVLARVLVTVGFLLVWLSSPAQAGEEIFLEPDLPLEKRKDDFDDDYRYDFEQRHLTLGLDFGGGLSAGGTLNAFPLGGSVTPYFRGAFGDGNALEFDLTVAFNPISGADAEWLFFRTPFEGGATAGYVMFIAPTVCFRYEIELTGSISHRARFLSWAGIGLGPAFSLGDASFTGNGSQPDKNLSNFEIFFDIVPTTGVRARLGEFGFIELGARFHLLWEIAAKVNEADQMTVGTPEVIDEFWIGNGRLFEIFLGFGYDFG